MHNNSSLPIVISKLATAPSLFSRCFLIGSILPGAVSFYFFSLLFSAILSVKDIRLSRRFSCSVNFDVYATNIA